MNARALEALSRNTGSYADIDGGKRQLIEARCSYLESMPIMLPFIIQSPQLPMCWCIQVTMSLHHPGEAVVEIEVREPLFIHCRQTEAIDEALPHIIGPVIRPFWSC